MKKLIYSLILCFVITSVSYADKVEASKSFKESYTTNSNTSFYIDNKYGDIIFADWTKNEISIKLEIKVKAKNQEKADEFLKQITAEIGQIGDSVFAKTNFAKKFHKTKKFDLEIKYVIKAPASLVYNINNKYGNIGIANITGPTKIDLKYGNLLAKKLNFTDVKKLNTIQLSYSNATIHYCNYANIKLKYGNLDLDKGKAAKIDAKYSDVSIIELETLHFDGAYGALKADTLQIANINCKYMNANIQYLSSKIKSVNKYGNLKVNNITPDFSNIDIKASFGNVKLLIHPDASYIVDAEADYGSIDFPKKASLERVVSSKGEQIKGKIGPKSKPTTGTVKLEVNYGNIQL